MLIKSSMETLELAYDAVNMVYKNLLNQPGQMYNKWFVKNGYGQDNAYIMAEHTDYSVRLFFTFQDTGFVYVDGYFTNGSSYDRKTITSWRFDNDEYPFEETTNHVKQVLDRFFDEGINVLRGEEVMNSRRPIKSGYSDVEKALNELEDYFGRSADGDTIYTRISHDDENHIAKVCEDYNVDFAVGSNHVTLYPIESSRRPIKSGLQDGEVIFRASTRGGKNTVEVVDTGDSVDRYAIEQDGSVDYADTIKGVLAKLLKQAGWKEDTFSKIDIDTANIGRDYLQIVKMINDEFGFLYKSSKGSRERQFYFDIIRFIAQNIERGSDMAIEDMIWKAKDALRAKGINSSCRPVKSSADNLPKEVYYIVVNGSRQYYEDYDEADDNLETLRAIGKGKVDGVYTETDPDEIYELYEVGYIGNSRRSVKSSGFVQVLDDYDDYKTYIVGKTENGKKLYYCEDGQYYAEEDFARPDIKIFDNEADAKKIAKRSKNGFATPLEVE